MARPEKNAEDRHGSWIKFRVTEAERNLIRERADTSGKSVSDFVRTLALTGLVEVRESQADFELIQAINRIGVNINQIAKRFNATDRLRYRALDLMLSRLDEYLDRLQDT
jgi:uncharacterized protein (DUF1778 family)